MDNYSRVIRTHTLTFGGQFRYNQLTEYNGGSNGDFEFHNGADGETGIEFADFLIGAPARYSQGQGYPSYGRSRYIGLFGQDSWRMKPNLTLNYGLRWDVSRPWSEKNGQLETLVPRPELDAISRFAYGMGVPRRSWHSQHACADPLGTTLLPASAWLIRLRRTVGCWRVDRRSGQDQHSRRLRQVLQHV